ncbi:TetR/AcrR family transcriptional regulator [Leucobacter luti]|uniref:TetR/AcrR family transcriptional regulator n=1 Tax=Leucobacter luti TaxID=340320 RepID=UPI001C687792|nr:TetR/AcrR family transcriptional regulator [Leucobacter luti]QYM75095.1 TetR/AcrR family transcriptional regulator [Leucobacter luti]
MTKGDAAGETEHADRATQPTTRARIRTRAALIDAAEAIFTERGTPTASIDEICTRAGFTRGAYYSNFRTVDDVFFALYERKTDALIAGMAGFDQHLPTAERTDTAVLEVAADEMLRVIPADTQWYALRALFGLRAASDPDMAAVLRTHGEALEHHMVPILEGISRIVGGELITDGAEATRIVIACHVGSVLQGPFVDDPARLRRDAILTALRGVLTTHATSH